MILKKTWVKYVYAAKLTFKYDQRLTVIICRETENIISMSSSWNTENNLQRHSKFSTSHQRNSDMRTGSQH